LLKEKKKPIEKAVLVSDKPQDQTLEASFSHSSICTSHRLSAFFLDRIFSPAMHTSGLLLVSWLGTSANIYTDS